MRFPTSITASPGLDGGDDESSSNDSEERLWASSARMASAMALPSMTFPRDDAAAAGGAASSGSVEEDDMAKNGSVVMQVDGGKVDDVGLEGGTLLS